MNTLTGAAANAEVTSEVWRLVARLAALSQPEPVSLDEWTRRVLARHGPDRPRSTRCRYRQALRELAVYLGPAATTSDLTPERLASFARELRRSGRRAETVNGLLRAVRAACALAVEWGCLSRSPFREFRDWAEPDPPRPKHLTRAEIARILADLAGDASWDGRRLHALVAVWAYTGLRRNEALRLRVEDLDLVRRVAWVRSTHGRRLKTRASAAAVPLPSRLVSILRRWVRQCGSEWLFPGARRRGPWVGGRAGTRAGDRLRAAAARLGIVGATPHALRHSLATHLAGWWGLNPRQIQMVLRHASERTQAHYVHPEISDLVAIVRGFDFGRSAPKRRRV